MLANILLNTYSLIEPKDVNNIKLNKNDSSFRFRSGGQYITFDELSLIAPSGSNTVLLRGSREESVTIGNSISGEQLMIPSKRNLDLNSKYK